MALGITGLHELVNPEEVKPGIDLKQLEQQLLKGGYTNKPIELPPMSKFEDELHKFSESLGLDVGKSTPKSVTFDPFDVSSVNTFTSKPTPAPIISTFDTINEVLPDPGPLYSHTQYTVDSTLGATNGGFIPSYGTPAPPSFNIDDAELTEKTAEQQRRAHIDNVLGLDSVGVDFDAERREEAKCYMLAQIDDLRTSLIEDGIDVSRIPQITVQSSYGDVETVLKILDHKANQARCTTWAHELMLFGTMGLENVFDGKRDFMGFTPNLTGYSKHVNVKMRRLKHDAGRVVHQFVQDNNISPLFRLAFETIPSMFLYSRRRNEEEKVSSDW